MNETSANEIIALEDRRITAMLDADVAALDVLIAVDCRYVHANGVVDTKAMYLNKLITGAMRYSRIDATERLVLRLGATSVVTSILNVEGIVGGTPRQLRTRAIAVWDCTAVSSRLIFCQATSAPPTD